MNVEILDKSTDLEISEAVSNRRFWNSWFWGVFAFVLVAFVATLYGPINAPDAQTIVNVSSVVFLCCMAGFWLGLGNGVIRIPCSTLGSCFVALIIAWKESSPVGAVYLYLVFNLLLTLTVAGSGYLLRIYVGELVQRKNSSHRNDALQFGVRHILIWTTVVAISIAIIRILPDGFGGRLEKLAMVTSLSLGMATIAVVQIWALFGQRLSINRIAALVFVLLFVAIGFEWLFPRDMIFWSYVAIISQLAVCGALYCVRRQDYRFEKSTG